MAQELFARRHELLCISRHADDVLAHAAAEQGAVLTQWRADLAEPAEVAARLADWLAARDASMIASATLINNAGAVAPPAPLAEAQQDQLQQALRVGLEAPLLLTAAFLRASAAWTAPRKVLNISSGLGRRAMASVAAYCAAKAGLDHLSRAVALEEGAKANGARIVSLAPGVIDTDMQEQLRGADAARFPDRERFVGLKDNAQLDSPQEAARKVLSWLARADFGSQPVADVRDGA